MERASAADTQQQSGRPLTHQVCERAELPGLGGRLGSGLGIGARCPSRRKSSTSRLSSPCLNSAFRALTNESPALGSGFELGPNPNLTVGSGSGHPDPLTRTHTPWRELGCEWSLIRLLAFDTSNVVEGKRARASAYACVWNRRCTPGRSTEPRPGAGLVCVAVGESRVPYPQP